MAPAMRPIPSEGRRSVGGGGRAFNKGWRGRRWLASGAVGSHGKKEMEGAHRRLSFGLSREREQEGGLAIAVSHGGGEGGSERRWRAIRQPLRMVVDNVEHGKRGGGGGWHVGRLGVGPSRSGRGNGDRWGTRR
jgi:hypothetical protein